MPTKGSTGVVGISIVRTRKKHKSALRSYFSVYHRTSDGKPHNRLFCMDTLGRAEAWRRALRYRALHG